MTIEDYIKLNEITLEQEERLRFLQFSNRDAWELGNYLVNKVYEEKQELAIAIRKLNGNILFQHCIEGTNLNNQNWMKRKFNTVSLMERSSLGAWAVSFITGEEIRTHGLSEKDYIFCGGGFPIRLKTGEMVAVLTVSNFPHERDHDFIVKALSEWLCVDNVPEIDLSQSY
jgi:Uncharacterized conserved protein